VNSDAGGAHKESTFRGHGLELLPGKGLTPACNYKCLKFKVPKMPKAKGS